MTASDTGSEQLVPASECPSCGTLAGEWARYCPTCGRRLGDATPDADIAGWVQAAWRLFVSDIPLAIGIALVSVIPTIAIFLLGYFGVIGMAMLSDPELGAPRVVLAVLGGVLGLMAMIVAFGLPALQGGIYACFLEGIRTGKLTAHNLWSGFRHLWACTWVTWMLGVAALLCLPLVFILIGIPLCLGLASLGWLSLFRIMDKREGGVEALSFAWGAMRGRLWTMLVYTLLVLTLMNAGAMGMYIGVVVTVPIGVAALAGGYDSLSRKDQSTPAA